MRRADNNRMKLIRYRHSSALGSGIANVALIRSSVNCGRYTLFMPVMHHRMFFAISRVDGKKYKKCMRSIIRSRIQEI